MDSVSIWHWFVVALVIFLWIFPLWRILARTGRPGAIALVALIPFLGLVLLWWIALARWPAQETGGHGTSAARR